MDVEDPQAEYELLRRELAEYSPELAAKPHCIVVTKADLLAPGQRAPSLSAPDTFASHVVSGVTRAGLAELAEGLWSAVRREIEAEGTQHEDENASPAD